MNDKPDSICPPGVVLTAAQMNALQYTTAGIHHRESDPGWAARRDAGLGIKSPPDGVTVGDSDPGVSVITEVKTSDSGFTTITNSYHTDLGSVLPNREPKEPLWLTHAKAAGKETEPNDLSPHTPGAKLDAGKNRLGLVFTDFAKAIEQVGLVATMGAAKYSPSGWVSVKGGKERYSDALFRHLVAHAKGEKLDGSGLLHLAHAAWNCLACLELELRTLTPEQKLERK